MQTSSAPPNSLSAVILTFSPNELSQLEAFATLHGESVVAFVQRAALDAAHIKAPSKKAKDTGDLWLTDNFTDAPEVKERKQTDLFAVADAQKESENVVAAPVAVAAKRGVTGEQSHLAKSHLAKGHGLVWEIRQALGLERVHGFGWTREQLAFFLKLSVVGVRKMEHLGTTPVKSLETRKALLTLAKALEHPTPEIVAYIKREEAALG